MINALKISPRLGKNNKWKLKCIDSPFGPSQPWTEKTTGMECDWTEKCSASNKGFPISPELMGREEIAFA